MIILVALVVFVLLYVGNAPTRRDQQLGREAYDQQQKNFHERNKVLAEQYDCYYEPNELSTMDINASYYGDGSLKKDGCTGKTYEKGKYYVDSKGMTAKRQYDSSQIKPS